MRIRTRIAPVAGAVATAAAVMLGAAACSSNTQEAKQETKAGGETGFWAAHASAAGLEAAPPASVTDVAARSDLVVLGTVSGATEGRDYSEKDKPPNRTSNVAIKVERSSDPGVERAVVEFTRHPGDELSDVVGGLPKGSYVFYLSAWYEGPDGPVYRCASAGSCVVGVENGALKTPRDPEAARELGPAAKARPRTAAADKPLTVEDVFAKSAGAVPGS
ncbi:hypothetical protein [Streptomyces sp. XD-27]|uniref:hypothetical protein n=1 Tax=Streptomyces sp. XD-27 TaxID=3062779 RepID=UPI0026F44C42|nr:hypothetical protein [Streptomyces sp. XD-27]WKX70622.1 hypothetical protein Q3Y56_12505 [Streptomyces sp. XD-27]